MSETAPDGASSFFASGYIIVRASFSLWWNNSHVEHDLHDTGAPVVFAMPKGTALTDELLSRRSYSPCPYGKCGGII